MSSNNPTEGGQQNVLFWTNHATEVAGTLLLLQQTGSMVDLTLRAEGKSIHVHKMVLCACSPYLQEILSSSEDPNPYIILPDTNMDDLQAIIEFIYRGELSFYNDQLPSILKIAEMMCIQGLTEISSQLPQIEQSEDEIMVDDLTGDVTGNVTCDVTCDAVNIDISSTPAHVWETAEMVVEGEELQHKAAALKHLHVQIKKDEDIEARNQKKKSRREAKLKQYNEETLEEALKELRAGRSLSEVVMSFNIPRTTLYMRARTTGILAPSQKSGYTSAQVEAAINAVKGGASLKQASSMHNIPKTVLWRRVSSIGGIVRRHHLLYSKEDKQAAVDALERGEQLNTVACQFPIPKTTLFREKSRLIEKGRLPRDSIRRRNSDTNDVKALRIKQAVEACKEGKMSQASASVTFQVPKTTIWRRLQPQLKKKKKEEQLDGNEDPLSLDDTELPQQCIEQRVCYEDENGLKYITTEEDGEYPSTSLVILTSVDCEELHSGGQIIVCTEPETEVCNEESSTIIEEPTVSPKDSS